MVTNCPQPIGFYEIDGELVPTPCRQWNCPVCGKVLKNKLLDRVGAGYQVLVARGGRVRALCLTLGPDADNKLMGKYFARFRAWLAKPRRHRKKLRSFRGINYFWTKEFQENGQLHLHILIDAYIPIQLLRKAWRWATYGTSKIVFITKVSTTIKRPAGYMTKYMHKELDQTEEFRRKERRYGFSRNKCSVFLPQTFRTWREHFIGDFPETTIKFRYEPSPVCPELKERYKRRAEGLRDKVEQLQRRP